MKGENWESLFPQGSVVISGVDDESALPSLDEENEEMMEEKTSDRPNTARSGKPDSSIEVGRSFENPPSWVTPITLERAKYQIRYPPIGRRTVQYYCAKADFFAKNEHPQVCSPLRRFLLPSSIFVYLGSLLSTHMIICLTIYLSVYVSIHLSIYLLSNRISS